MNFFLTALRKFFDFSGRATRAEYWFFMLFYALLGLPVAAAEGLTGFEDLSLAYTLALLLPATAVTTRRLHDTGQSGWLQAPPIVATVMAVSATALVYAMPTSGTFLLWITAVLFLLVSLGFLLYFLVKDGEAAGNRFGPSLKSEPRF